MADNIPSLPGGAVPPKPPEASKVQPKKETVRINLPPKPSAAPTIKLPTLPPGGPTAGAPSSFPPPTQIATPTGSKAAAAPVAPKSVSAPQPRPAPAPVRPAVTGLDKVLAIVALVAVVAAAVSTGICMNLLMNDGVPENLIGLNLCRPMASNNIIILTKANFDQQVLKSTTPVLVDFWAEWCGPCKMIAPVLDELADEYSGKVQIAKVNIDENQDLATEYGVRAIPTLLIFHGGQVTEQIVGLRSKRDLKASFDKLT